MNFDSFCDYRIIRTIKQNILPDCYVNTPAIVEYDKLAVHFKLESDLVESLNSK